jgi:hypothetical protein
MPDPLQCGILRTDPGQITHTDLRHGLGLGSGGRMHTIDVWAAIKMKPKRIILVTIEPWHVTVEREIRRILLEGWGQQEVVMPEKEPEIKMPIEESTFPLCGDPTKPCDNRAHNYRGCAYSVGPGMGCSKHEHCIQPDMRPPSEHYGNWPPPATHCPECGAYHEPEYPHDRESVFYQIKFKRRTGRWPTWADALAHCPPDIKTIWIEELVSRGIDPNKVEEAKR